MEKIARKGIRLNKQERLIYRYNYYFYALKSSHFIVKVVTTRFGDHYSNLNDFTASTCSHSFCRTSAAEDSGGAWRPTDLQLKAGLSLDLLAGIGMGSQNLLRFHAFLDDVLLVECTQA